MVSTLAAANVFNNYFSLLQQILSLGNMFICKAEDRWTLLEVRTVENADAPRLDRFG
jgi:hypothetical protein